MKLRAQAINAPEALMLFFDSVTQLSSSRVIRVSITLLLFLLLILLSCYSVTDHSIVSVQFMHFLWCNLLLQFEQKIFT
jgi:hypothetical protein